MNDRLKYASNPAIYKDAIRELEKLNGVTNLLQAYCKHCCILTYNGQNCPVCDNTDLQPIIINVQRGKIK